MKKTAAFLLTAMTLFSVHSQAGTFDPVEADEQRVVQGALIAESSQRVLVMIDGAEVATIEQLHQIFVEALHLPAHYGRNFDALYDVLTDQDLISKDIDVTIIQGNRLKENVGADKVQTLLDVLNDAQEVDPSHLSVTYWD